MTTYLVTWRIDVDADTPEDAAKMARAIQLNSDSRETVFTVQTVDQEWKGVEGIEIDVGGWEA